ncbi:MAG: MFS transporter [Candidatus Eremiobacteraeota bacterium]|nr:MFS transporter [Candidatus Eremiobacteraeota bacterium]
MVHSNDLVQKSPEYKFELRRLVNWLPLGMMYAAFYMSRYNFTVTNPALCKEFGWSNAQIGGVISLSLLVYGLSVFLNGPIADKIGGKKAILIGCIGALVFNLLFAAGVCFRIFSWDKAPWVGLLTYFSVIWAFNMYFQSFGALSVVKVNASWFSISERGIFAGLFGAMIQFGRILAVPVGGVILATSSWEWVHVVPAIVLGLIGLLTLLVVKDTPEELGFPRQDEVLVVEEKEESPSLGAILKTILLNPTMLIITGAMMATGLIRHSLEQWAPKYFIDVHGVSSDSMIFILAFAGQVMIGIFGAFVMGNVSDRYFQSRRGPVTAIAYFVQAFLLLAFALLKPGPWLAAIILMLFYFFLNGCHGLIAGTASMDFGGRKAAATAAGLLDGSQYLVGSIAGIGMGMLLDRFGWGAWSWSIIIFALIAGALMATRWNVLPPRAKKQELVVCRKCEASYHINDESCSQCGEANPEITLKKIVLMSKEAFNTAIFSIFMFLFPLIILISKVLGGIVKPETRSDSVNSVLIFAFLGILIGLLAYNRSIAARRLIELKNMGTQYLEIVKPSSSLAKAALILSGIATVYGFIWLQKCL